MSSIVNWVGPGLGAVASRSLIELTWGPRGLFPMRSDVPALAALATPHCALADSPMR